jgi:hypothetical protein
LHDTLRFPSFFLLRDSTTCERITKLNILFKKKKKNKNVKKTTMCVSAAKRKGAGGEEIDTAGDGS